MGATITNFHDLQQWFLANGSEARPSAGWTLYSYNNGKLAIFAKNLNQRDKNIALGDLVDAVRRANGSGGIHLVAHQWDFGSSDSKTDNSNNKVGETNIRIFENNAATTQVAGIAGIGNTGGGGIMGISTKADLDDYVDQKLKDQAARIALEHRLDELEKSKVPEPTLMDQINGILENPNLTPLINAVAARVMGLPPQAMQPPINGTPAPQPHYTPNEAKPIDDDDDEEYQKLVDDTTNILGCDDLELMRKLNAMVRSNPTLAKQMLQNS